MFDNDKKEVLSSMFILLSRISDNLGIDFIVEV